MSNYDAWLERPYQDAAAEQEAFIRWCEDNDVDPDDRDAYNDFMEEMQEAAEDAAAAKGEAMMEARREGYY